jgi:hypothetical protein
MDKIPKQGKYPIFALNVRGFNREKSKIIMKTILSIPKFCLFLVNLWHTTVWLIFTKKSSRYVLGRYIIKGISLFYGTLVILNILAPAEGEIPCLIHLIFRNKNIHSIIPFKKKIKYLIKFWRATL